MIRNIRRKPTGSAACLCVLAALAFAPQVDARQDSADKELRLATVTADDVYVRSGPADSYYPFGKLCTGDVVRVIGERSNWARIVTEGPAFKDFFGFVRYPSADSGRFRLEEGGKGRTLGRIDLLAPNLNTDYNPRDSWKRILLLEADTVVTVQETTEADGNVVHKVDLPPKAEGWISLNYLESADAAQIARWRLATPDAKPEKIEPIVEEDDNAITEESTSEPGVLANQEQSLPPVEKPIENARETPDDVTKEAGTATPMEPDVTEPVVADSDEPVEVETDAAAEMDSGKDVAPPTAQEQFDALEEAYRKLREEPIVSAEVQPLRQLYIDLAGRSTDDATVRRYAEVRSKQLKLWEELQQSRVEMARLKTRLDLTAENTATAKLALETTGQYVAVGRLIASTIYDGQRLPRLLRLQDVSTGRTVAYLRIDDQADFDLPSMLGQIIGIMGDKSYDGGLRLNIIKPKRIDLLARQG